MQSATNLIEDSKHVSQGLVDIKEHHKMAREERGSLYRHSTHIS